MSDELELIAGPILQIQVINEQQEALAAQVPSPPSPIDAEASALMFTEQAPPSRDDEQAEAAMVLLFSQQLGAHGTLRQVEEDRKRKQEEKKEDSDDE